MRHDSLLMLHDYRLTTAQIYYRFPDYPDLLQEFIWQDMDLSPRYPELRKFLTYWEREIEGKLHSIQVSSAGLLKPQTLRFLDGDLHFLN